MTDTNYRLNLIIVSLIAALGGLLFGFDTGVISGTQLYFTEYFKLSAGSQGWAVGSALYGALGGAMVAGFLTIVLGRKNALILSAILFILSAWGSGIATSLFELGIYRIIGGVGVGIASMTAPMYIAEMSPAKIRGQMVSLYQLAIVLGFFVVFLVTYWIGGGTEETPDLHKYNVEEGWRVMFWSELIPAGLFLLLLFFVPKSPRWLVMRGQIDTAKNVLSRIMSNDMVDKEIEDIKSTVSSKEKVDWTKLFEGKMRTVLLIGILLSVFQQVTGINAILYYGAEIFSEALQYGPEDALKQQLWLGTVNLVFTFVAIFSVDKWGRKPLLIVGVMGMTMGLAVLGLSIYLQQLGVIALISMLTFVGSFALSMGPVVWVMLSEIYPNKYRSMALSIAVAAQWLANAIVANTFPIINKSALNMESYNGALPYFIFAVMGIVTIIFVIRMVPETKNKSLEEIEKFWTK